MQRPGAPAHTSECRPEPRAGSNASGYLARSARSVLAGRETGRREGSKQEHKGNGDRSTAAMGEVKGRGEER